MLSVATRSHPDRACEPSQPRRRSAVEFDLDSSLAAARAGDPGAAHALATAVYADFRRLARQFLQRERADHTLQPTALANEVYLRLFEAPFPQFNSRSEFFVAAARTIRRILIEHARARRTQKRGGGYSRVDLDADLMASGGPRDERLVALDAALEKLAAVDPAKARLVELRFFGGFSVAEAAQLLGASERTAAREWRIARAFLESEIGDGAVRTDGDDVDRGAMA